ncbi:MAG: HIRAN domain-containing protein [Rhodocyclaceae bacterium]|nr:HIRAN domain-containing protein [Rhodocyclaceae bacterium]
MRIRLLLLFAALAVGSAQAQSVKLLVQSSPLAGFQYYAGEDLWREMKEGDRLTLVREPANAHDTKAVRVEWRGTKLGYLPRAENGAVAEEMDRGARVEARIAKLLPHRNPWRRILMEVFVVL